MDDLEKQRQADGLQRDLSDNGLSRRAFLDRLKVLGVGFGAAAMLGGRRADADVRFDAPADASVKLRSSKPELNNIIEEGRQDFAEYGGTPGVPGSGCGGPGPGPKPGYSRSGYSRSGYSRAVYSRDYPRGGG